MTNGDHSRYGFWSTNFKDLGNPKITDFEKIIEELYNICTGRNCQR
jgi:hypothetical protein